MSTKGKLEIEIEEPAVEYSKSLGYLSYKQNGEGNRGKPDRVFVSLYGEHIYIEFKRPGETLDPLQWLNARELAQRRCVVYECSDLRHARRILDNHVRPGAEPISGVITYEMASEKLVETRIKLNERTE